MNWGAPQVVDAVQVERCCLRVALGLEDRMDQLGPTRPGVEVSHDGLVDRAGEVVI